MFNVFKGPLVVRPNVLTVERIRKDNPHFGTAVRVIEIDSNYNSDIFDFNKRVTVGSENSVVDGRKLDAWASYLWSPSKKAWCLGAN